MISCGWRTGGERMEEDCSIFSPSSLSYHSSSPPPPRFLSSSSDMKRLKFRSNPSSCSIINSSSSSTSTSSSLLSSTCRWNQTIPSKNSKKRSFASQPRRIRPGASATDSTDLGRHFYLNKVLEQWAARPATRMTLRQLVFFGKTLGRDRDKILKSANYVRQELPIRIAHRIRDLQALPFVVMSNVHLEEVYNKYWHAFETFRRLSHISNLEENEKFCSLLKELLEDHLTIIPSLTIGIVESSNHLPSDQLDGFMERMLRSRISRRVLAEQHISLSEALDDPFHFFNDPSTAVGANHDSQPGGRNHSDPEAEADPEADLDPDLEIGDHVGIIYTHLSVASVVRKGVKLLTEMFTEELIKEKPNLLGLDRKEAEKLIPKIVLDGDLKTRFAYIPEHLEYIVFELLKNAIRATLKRDPKLWDQIPIRVTIVEGPPDEDVIIRISDSGGGLPDLVSKLSSPNPSLSLGANPATMMTRDSTNSNATSNIDTNTSNLPNTITQTSPTSAGAVGVSSSLSSLAGDSSISSSSSSSSNPRSGRNSNVTSSTSDFESSKLHSSTATPPGAVTSGSLGSGREFDFELDHSDQAFYGSDPTGSVSAPISPHQTPPSDTSFLTQWPFTPTPVGPQVNNDPLVDILCSFSNVRKRLEIEERDRLISAFWDGKRGTNPDGNGNGNGNGIGEKQKQELEIKNQNKDNSQVESGNQAGNEKGLGLGSRDRMNALRKVGTFKGTVKEQVLASGRSSIGRDSSQSGNPSRAGTSVKSSATSGSTSSSSSSSSSASSSSSGSNPSRFQSVPADGTGPMALRNLKAETGLGLPMTKVYCDFFGGNLSFRSLDGHSTDVYVRLPKLGTKKETIEEIVL